jgi:hypothetical protein
MKKVVKVLFIISFFAFFGCSSKIIFANNPLIDKKPLFNLSSLSVETAQNHISGEISLAKPLSDAAQKRALDSVYFTGFQKGILKLKVEKVEIIKTKERRGSFLYFFPSYEKGLSGHISYTLTAYSSRQEELKSVSYKLDFKVKGQSSSNEKELIEGLLNDFQDSIYKASKNELAAFSASR